MPIQVACLKCQVLFAVETAKRDKTTPFKDIKLEKQPRCWSCGRWLPQYLIKINADLNQVKWNR